jgi:hypothetical protein
MYTVSPFEAISGPAHEAVNTGVVFNVTGVVNAFPFHLANLQDESATSPHTTNGLPEASTTIRGWLFPYPDETMSIAGDHIIPVCAVAVNANNKKEIRLYIRIPINFLKYINYQLNKR